jgi:hypothetical protein
MTRPAPRGGRDRDAAGQGRDAAGRGRDRDAAGRPRNARPRDELGRPLSRDAGGEPPLADDAALPPASALALAQQLIDDGRAFRAHEVLEAAWKAAPDGERELWQGLAQVAVGLTHAQRGNARGAVTLLRRGAARVGRYSPGAPSAGPAGDPAGSPHATDAAGDPCGTAAAGSPHGIDAAGIARSAGLLANLIEQAGLDAIPAGGMHIRITPPGNANSATVNI